MKKDISGHELEITLGSLDEAMELKRAIGESIQQSNIDISPEVLEGELDASAIGSLVRIVLSVGISKRVEQAVFACAKRATWDGERITRDMFEAAEMRGFYYPIMVEVIKANLSPFFSEIGSSFMGLVGSLKQSQEQKSTSPKNKL